MTLLDAVFVDFDGTLVDSEYANACAYAAALRRFGFLKKASEVNEIILGSHWSQFLPLIMGTSYTDDAGRRVAELKKNLYPAFYSKIMLNLPLISLLEVLKQTTPVIIVSNGTRGSIINILEHFNIVQIFNLVVSFDDVEKPKPDPEIYKFALEAMGASASNSIAFEDSSIGCIAAKAAGIAVIKVKNPEWVGN